MSGTTSHGSVRHTWIAKAIVLTVLALSCAAAYWLGSSVRRAGAEQELVVADSHLDLGQVWEDKNFHWELPVQNRTNRDIAILGFSSSCSCLSVEPRSMVVPSGETANVRLTLDLTRTDWQRTASLNGDFQASLFPRIRGGQANQRAWQIRAKVRRAFTLSPEIVNFEESLVRGKPFPPRTVILTPHTPLKNVEAKCDPRLATVRVTRSASPEEKFRIQIAPQNDLPADSLKFDVTVIVAVADCDQVPSTALPVRALVADDIVAVPPSILFGCLPLGQTVRETIVLQSLSGKSFQVEGVERTSDDVSIEPPAAGMSVGNAVRLTQRISKKGHHSTTVKFLIRTENEKELTTSVHLSYDGTLDNQVSPLTHTQPLNSSSSNAATGIPRASED